MVLAISNETDALVSEYIEKMGITVRTSAGFSTGEEWGVRGYPSAALINAKGELTWTGDPRSLSKGKVKEALKGAKGSSAGYLSYTTSTALDGKLQKAVKSAAAGKLGKAYTTALALTTDESLGQAIRDEAQAFADEIQAYTVLLNSQAESKIKQLRVLDGIEILESLEGAVKGLDLQAEIINRLDQIEKDEGLQLEIEAEIALNRALAAAEKRGVKKAKSKFESVIKKFPDTAAAKRAKKAMRVKRNP